jgi:hypothetical protein
VGKRLCTEVQPDMSKTVAATTFGLSYRGRGREIGTATLPANGIHFYLDTAKAITSFRQSFSVRSSSSRRSTISVEVAVHTILRTRQVYPADLFVRRKKYDAPVYQSRHPALNEYIAGAIKAVGEELLVVNDAPHLNSLPKS